MATNFFSSIADIKEIKREYIKLLKQWHPDNFSEQAAITKAVQVTQEINAQYDKKLTYLKSHVHSSFQRNAHFALAVWGVQSERSVISISATGL